MAMFRDIEAYARTHNDTFYWADDVGVAYRIQAYPGKTWEITPQDVRASARAGRSLDIAHLIRTAAGKEAILKSLNEIKHQCPPPPRTAWARIASDH